MKTKFYWLALIVSAALSAPAQAGNHHGGGNSAVAARAPARSSAPSFQSTPRGNFGGRPMITPSQRFSSVGMRASSNAFRQHYINSSGNAAIGTRQFTSGNFNRSSRLGRFQNQRNHAITNQVGEGMGAIQNQTAGGNRLTRFGTSRRNHLAQTGNGNGQGNGAIGNHRNGNGQVRNGNNNLRADWRNHVFARRSAQWNRNWDRNRDHRWHGHDCRFVNGSWIIFDLGFYPWWPYSYPYDYYAYDYDYYPYRYNYDPGYYDPGYNDSRYNDSGYNDSGVYQGEEYYDQGNYDSSDQYSSSDSTIAAVQERLARQGYYRGEIDGILGPQTRRAIARYQRGHGLSVTGNLTPDMLQALGLEELASN